MNEDELSRRSEWYDTTYGGGAPNWFTQSLPADAAPHPTPQIPPHRTAGNPPRSGAGYPPAPQGRRGSAIRAVAICLVCLVVIAASSLLFARDSAAEREEVQPSPQVTLPGGYDDFREFFDNYYDSTSTITGENDIPRAELPQGVSLTTVPVPEPSEELTLHEIYEKCAPSVVAIAATVPDSTGYFWGTGIVLTEDGYVVTNTHVLDGTDSVVVTLWDDSEYEAKLVGADNVSDIAVLKIEAEGLTPAEFCGTSVSIGDRVAALGNPLGMELRGTLTDGIVSAINRDVSYNSHSMTLLQTNAAINEGNSGGPLLNMYGQVVGITNMKMMSTTGYSSVEGIGFAIPTSTIQEVVNQLLKNGKVTGRAAIGITIGPIPESASEAYELPEGLYVVSVAAGSDAEAKGLVEGDIVTMVNGQSVTTTAQVGALIEDLEVGDTITLTVYREGETFEVEVALVETSDIY